MESTTPGTLEAIKRALQTAVDKQLQVLTQYHAPDYREENGDPTPFQPSWDENVLRILRGTIEQEDLVSNVSRLTFDKDLTEHKNAMRTSLHARLFEHYVQITQMELVRRRAGGANPNWKQKIEFDGVTGKQPHKDIKTGAGKLQPNTLSIPNESKDPKRTNVSDGAKFASGDQPNNPKSNYNPIPAMMGEEWETRIRKVLSKRTETEDIKGLLKYLGAPVVKTGRKFPSGRAVTFSDDALKANAPVDLTKDGVGRVLIAGM